MIRRALRWLGGVSISFPATRRDRAKMLAEARRIYGFDLTDEQRADRLRNSIRRLDAVHPNAEVCEMAEALTRVRNLHSPRPHSFGSDFMCFGQTEFPDLCAHCRRVYPCETAQALDSAGNV